MNQKQKELFKTTFIMIFAILILIIIVKCFHKTSIHISNLPNEEIYFNSTGKKLVTGKSKNGIVKLKQKLEPGVYILYYDINPNERWYATLHVKKSMEEVELNFRKHALPHTKKRLNLEDELDDVELANRNWRYSIYNDKNNEIYYRVELNLSLRGKHTDGKYTYIAKWWLDINGNIESKDQITMTSEENKTIPVFEDQLHKVDVVINTNNDNASFEMNSVLQNKK